MLLLFFFILFFDPTCFLLSIRNLHHHLSSNVTSITQSSQPKNYFLISEYSLKIYFAVVFFIICTIFERKYFFQLHCANGFLLSNLISHYTNRRTDRWGGSIENRARIVTEITRRIKEQDGADFPILVKLNTTDGFQQGSQKTDLGINISQVLEIAKLLEKREYVQSRLAEGSVRQIK